MPRRTDALARSAAVLAAVALLAGACGDETAAGKPEEVVGAAPGATLAAGPAQVTIDRFLLRAEGVVDLARSAARLTVRQSGEGAPGPTEVLVVGERSWTRPVGSATWQPADPGAGGLVGLPAGLVSGDVRMAVALVRGSSRVRVFGGLQVQQTSTVRYDAFCDPTAAAAATEDPAVKARLLGLAAAVSQPVRVDVYVDGDRRIRRLEVPEDVTTATPSTRVDGNRISATIDLVRFGVDAGDLAPPA